jgi:hypothetical protein
MRLKFVVLPGRPVRSAMGDRSPIALSISDDLADLLNRSRRATVQNGVPSARTSGLDMSVWSSRKTISCGSTPNSFPVRLKIAGSGLAKPTSWE